MCKCVCACACVCVCVCVCVRVRVCMKERERERERVCVSLIWSVIDLKVRIQPKIIYCQKPIIAHISFHKGTHIHWTTLWRLQESKSGLTKNISKDGFSESIDIDWSLVKVVKLVFLCYFKLLLMWEKLGWLGEIGFSPNSINHNQVKLVQVLDTYCSQRTKFLQKKKNWLPQIKSISRDENFKSWLLLKLVSS